MPELPEVETVVRALAPHLPGRRILEARFFSPRARRGPAVPLAGRTIRAVRRHGKFILLELDRGWLAIHLGMTGRLLLGGGRGSYTRAILHLDEGALRFDDVRQFGFLRWQAGLPEALGPDALSISLEEFARRLRARRGAIKPLLLDQSFLSGVGNIYADEALFRARLHPRARAARLGPQRARRLYAALREVLEEAIAEGGSSVSDYVDARGNPGFFQFFHRVYRKTGQPCPACGAPVRRLVLAQRSAHYCPRCQRP